MELKEILNNLLYLVITGVVPLVVVYLTKLLKVKIAELSSKTENETIEKYINDAVDAITTAVISTTQTYVDSIKKVGKFDDTAQENAFNMAKETALKLITVDMENAITTVYGDFEVFINKKIEELVKLNK